MDKNMRSCLAELIGTFIVVLVSAGVVCVAQLGVFNGQPGVYLVGIALAQGLILAAALTTTLPVSGGYLNPAITLMLWVFKRMDGNKAMWLIGSQLVGALLAGMCIRPLFKEIILQEACCGTPHLNPEVWGFTANSAAPPNIVITGILVEVLLAFVFTFVLFGTTIDPRAPRLGGLGAGLALTAVVLMGYPLTGAGINPARWFGTFVWEMTLPGSSRGAEHLAYWVGPIFGALLAGAAYQYLILPDEPEVKKHEPTPASTTASAPKAGQKAKV